MLIFRHSIRKETIDVEVDSEPLAWALEARLPDINRRCFIPVIERVFDELALPGRQIKIAGLEVDLGPVPLDNLDTVAAERLDSELRRVLSEALKGADEGSRSEDDAVLEVLEYYLVKGALPFWAPSPEEFRFEALVLELISRAPEPLTGVIRRCGRQSRILERLAQQLEEPALKRLVGALDPVNAALIIAYTIDLEGVHQVTALPPVSDSEFKRLLWFLVLAYLVQDPGSQFNRKSFVKSLLVGMAESEGTSYHGLVAALNLGLRETEKALSLKSSLPAVIGELVRELGLEEKAAAQPASQQFGSGSRLALLDRFLADAVRPFGEQEEASMPVHDLVLELAATEPAGLIGLIRKRGRQIHALERLVVEMEDAALLRLLRLLDPKHSALIIAYMTDLRGVHRVELLLPLSETQFDRLTWLLVLAYLARDPGSQFNRKAFVKSLLEGMAESQALDYVEILATLRFGLRETARRAPIKSSLPAIVSELANELNLDSGGRESRPSEHGGQGATPEPHFVPAEYDRLDVARYCLEYGMLPWALAIREPRLTIEQALGAIADLPAALVRSLFCEERPTKRLERLRRVARSLSDTKLQGLLERLLPRVQGADNPFWQAVQSFAPVAKDKHTFIARVIEAILDGDSIDLEDLAASGLEPVAAGSFLPNAPTNWEAHTLKSAIVTQFQAGGRSGMGEHTLADLLHALIVRHPEEARHFFRAAQNTTVMQVGLRLLCEKPLFDDLLALLRPGEVETLNAFIDMLMEIPSLYRPGSEWSIREAILAEVLHIDEDRMLSDYFFLRTIQTLFATPLPAQAKSSMLQAVAAWASRGVATMSHIAAVESAIKTAAARANGSAQENESDENGVPERAFLQPRPLDVVEAFLLGSGARDPSIIEHLSPDALSHDFLALCEGSPDEVAAIIGAHAGDEKAQERWVTILPESALARVIYLLEPRRGRVLIEAAELLTAAWVERADGAHTALAGRRILWTFLLSFLAATAEANRTVERLAAAFLQYCTSRFLPAASSTAEVAQIGSDVLEAAERLAGESGDTVLAAILRRKHLALIAPIESPPSRDRDQRAGSRSGPRSSKRSSGGRLPGRRGRTAFSMEEDEAGEAGDPIYIGNAGLVLTSPFLPHLFESLDMLDRDEEGRVKFRDDSAASRAVHLLQYLVDGSTAAPEPLLVLNKILCGAAVASPVERGILMTDQELRACEQLLRSMIEHWTIIRNTSIEGLQETFLERQGRLVRGDDGWGLTVQRKTLDVLVDQVPWSISVILHDWMAQPVLVTW